uniref:Uncharacterized protein n=1 Tax=Lactuca sativa TaxID=4236 RepID=A0A9R1WDV5_LACSA|nr:hypothetical protein LSAT_V11C200092820 [Lactuca sativa]
MSFFTYFYLNLLLCLYQRHQLSIKNSQIKRSGEFGNRHLCPASSDHWLVSLMKILKKNDAGEVLIVCCSLALIGVALLYLNRSSSMAHIFIINIEIWCLFSSPQRKFKTLDT